MKAYGQSECLSVSQSASQRVGVAYLAWAIAHNALKPPIKSFATIEVMPASLIRLDKSLILTQLQLQQTERKRKEREKWERVGIERERGAEGGDTDKVQNTSTAASRSNPICH